MGYLLKEVLKTLCGVNQWSYAVYWKIGCQNPKVLMWEDCYYETASFSRLTGNFNPEKTFHDYSAAGLSGEARNLQASFEAAGKVHLLVSKMMMDNEVNIVGEGLVGRVALTGNYQWVEVGKYREAQPPKVQKELCLQFAAGIQTVAVLPVLPHGVVQFGSSFTITENLVFVNDATLLLHQLGYLNKLPEEHAPNTVTTPSSFDGFHYISNSVEPSMVDSRTPLPFTPTKAEPHHFKKIAHRMCYFDEGNMSSKNLSSTMVKRELLNMGSDEKQDFGEDLFDILGADFKNKLLNNSRNRESSSNFRSMANNSQGNSESGVFSLSNSDDHLLEAVVSRVHCPKAKRGLDDGVSSEPNSCFPPLDQFEISDRMEESGAYSCARGHSIHGSQVSVSTGYSKKADENGGKTGRKRLKPGENPRPRPKDRQMIQDRVKELREIVPNGEKCSIDSLLERTIKHMLFLQSVTKHAEKLKQTGESKIIRKDGGLLLKDNFEGGATWAYEVGSKSIVCPIIVEDLNLPGQMLVEMICEERGLFLEIAEIIRGLGLTILKGVMETRQDKIRARFVVEANRDVTRMEIFISLVRLLEQTVEKGDPQPN